MLDPGHYLPLLSRKRYSGSGNYRRAFLQAVLHVRAQKRGQGRNSFLVSRGKRADVRFFSLPAPSAEEAVAIFDATR